MLNRTLALFNQTLRTQSRRLPVHIALCLFVTVIFSLTLATASDTHPVSAPGLVLFQAISYINFIFIFSVASLFFCSAISEEKEEGTLGLLKLTGLSPLVLLLGKSSSRLVFALVLLTVQLPFMQLSVTLGGFKPVQILAVYLALVSFAFMVANLGLFCSVVCRDTGSALGVYSIIVALFGWIPALCYGALDYLDQPGYSASFYEKACWFLVKFLVEESVVGRLDQIFITGFDGQLLCPQVWSNLIIGAGFFLSSWVSFDYCTPDNIEKNVDPPLTDLVMRKEPLRRKCVGRVWRMPFAWKEFHFVVGGYSMMIIKFIIYGLLLVVIPLCLMWLDERDMWKVIYNISRIGNWTMSGAFFFLYIESLVTADCMYREEYQSNTLSSLMVTPSNLGRITVEKVLGDLYSLMPILFYLILGALFSMTDWLGGENYTPVTIENSLFLLAILITLIHLSVNISVHRRWRGQISSMSLSSLIGAFIFGTSVQTVNYASWASDLFLRTSALLIIPCLLMQISIRKRIKKLAEE